MKKFKYVILVILIMTMSGCYKETTLENSDIKVSAYPIEYITKRLYEQHSSIQSIYPDNMDDKYEVSDKLLDDYSSTDIFIFNSNEDRENDYVYKMFKKNKDLRIIDATASLTYNNKLEELWLDPMNYLTMANNIRKGFEEYISIAYLNNDINSNYDKLKSDLVQLEADYRETANRASNKNIIVGDDLFLYLTKYDLNVISIERSKNFTNKSLYTAEDLIKNGKAKTIYIKKGQKLSSDIEKLKKEYNVEVVELDTLYTITEEDRKNNQDYLTIMYNNLEELKKELYKD